MPWSARASRTVPTERVFVIPIGPWSMPASRIHSRPVSSPLPFSVKAPANSGSLHTSPSWGRITVTPVRTGPSPTTSGPEPRMSVVWPTRTPRTSVIAFRGPGVPSPITIPRSRARTGARDAAERAAPLDMFKRAPSVDLARRDDVHALDPVDRLDGRRDRRRGAGAKREVGPVAVATFALRGDGHDVDAVGREDGGDLPDEINLRERQPDLHLRHGRPVESLGKRIDRPEAHEDHACGHRRDHVLP